MIEIRQKVNIKLPDAIIAASAITLGLPIITADKQFERIPGLSTIIYSR